MGCVALLDWKHASLPSLGQLGNCFCLGGHKSLRARAFLRVSKATWPALRASDEMEEQNQVLTHQVVVKRARTKPSSELN